jgi:hypothetical protein
MFISPVDGDHAPSVAILISLWARTPYPVRIRTPSRLSRRVRPRVPAFEGGELIGKPRWVARSNAIVRGD